MHIYHDINDETEKVNESIDTIEKITVDETKSHNVNQSTWYFTPAP